MCSEESKQVWLLVPMWSTQSDLEKIRSVRISSLVWERSKPRLTKLISSPEKNPSEKSRKLGWDQVGLGACFHPTTWPSPLNPTMRSWPGRQSWGSGDHAKSCGWGVLGRWGCFLSARRTPLFLTSCSFSGGPASAFKGRHFPSCWWLEGASWEWTPTPTPASLFQTVLVGVQ